MAGLTTLAAALVDRVAITTATIEKNTITGESKRRTRITGSHIASPKMTMVALVTATPIKANRAIVVGRPAACPTTCARWLFAWRVKSEMFRHRVDQKPTMAVRLGKNSA